MWAWTRWRSWQSCLQTVFGDVERAGGFPPIQVSDGRRCWGCTCTTPDNTDGERDAQQRHRRDSALRIIPHRPSTPHSRLRQAGTHLASYRARPAAADGKTATVRDSVIGTVELPWLGLHRQRRPAKRCGGPGFVPGWLLSVRGSLMGQLVLSGIASQTNRRTKSRQRRSETRGVRQELRHANWLVGEVSASARLVSLLRLRDRSAVGTRRDRHVSGGKQRRLHPSPGGVHGGAGDVGGVRG